MGLCFWVQWWALPAVEEGFPFLVLHQKAPKNITGGVRWFKGWVKERHARFAEQPAALAMVAGRTGSCYVAPGVAPAQVAWDDVVYRQAAGAFSAILTGEMVATQHFAAAELDLGTRAVNHLMEANDRGPGKCARGGVNFAPSIGNQRGFIAQQQAHCTMQGTGVDRFKIGVQDQYHVIHRIAPRNYSMLERLFFDSENEYD